MWLFLILSLFSSASDDGRFIDGYFHEQNKIAIEKQKNLPASRLSSEEIYRRTQVVLNHFQVPLEKNYQPELDALVYSTDANYFNQHRKNLDPFAQIDRFYNIFPDQIISYKDRDSKKIPEYLMPTRKNSQSKSLQGLRVVLDPGHMGGDVWDERTGKYVIRGKTKVSEALMALQTALLIEKQLLAMGAQVLITHRELGPVSKIPFENLDLKNYARQELRYRSLEAWFQNILISSAEKDLTSQFEKSPERQKLFSEIMRGEYYTVREDLFARTKMINDFKPDLTVVIHFDAATREPKANAPNRSFAYVAGNFPATDFSTTETRAHILAHLATGEQWQNSVHLSQQIVGQMSQDLQLPLATQAHLGLPVAPGVFTRNLVLPRQAVTAPMSYLECFYYANTAEFERVLKTDGGQIVIGGKTYAYSQRLNVLSNAITKGIVNYALSPARF